MPWIRWINRSRRRAQSKKLLKWLTNNPGRNEIPEILKCFSLRPIYSRP